MGTHFLKKLGPGLLFAGAAIGVSHLVQSTRAGADYGFGLVWALLLIHLVKYPFFQYGPRYTAATGNSLLEGYRDLGKWVLVIYFILTVLTMFTIQTAVTIVTAGIATNLIGIELDIKYWSIIITLICAAILILGRYTLLDRLIKVIIVVLSISTLMAVGFALFNSDYELNLTQTIPNTQSGIIFLIAFMGWMPAPLDISIWHSLWSLEKSKEEKISQKSAVFDFNMGYLGTIVIGICFITLGALVMYPSGKTFSNSGGVFAKELIAMYTSHLGDWSYIIIAIAAFTTMFSTTLTTLDASPRSLARASILLFPKKKFANYNFWLLILILGTSVILVFLISEMGLLVQIATIASFITAPFYAISNYLAINSKQISPEFRPNKLEHIMSIVSIILLIVFSLWYLSTLLF